MTQPTRFPLAATALAAAALATACGGGGGLEANVKPAFIGNVQQTEYDGSTDDLLTAGLGKTGLAGAAPGYANAAAPTAAELRRHAIYTNYRALLDMTAAGGYGLLYGPNVAVDGTVTTGEGKVAGGEYVAYADDGTGRQNVTLLVQVPSSFDPAKPCIVTATSSGSRGVYGALSAGEWGLKRGCAVAYTDKGTGAAPHDLQNDTVPLIDGRRASAATAGNAAAFRAALTPAELATFNAQTPNRFAFKHAHSQQNPEKDWGKSTLQAVQFAFYVLNERLGKLSDTTRLQTFARGNTIVIASSASNGGGSALAAAELDTEGWIDGVAVSEPAVELPADPGVSIRRGANAIPVSARTLIDFTTYAQVFQPCASLAASLAGTPYQAAYAAGFGALAGARCASLQAKGLLAATTTAAQAEEALAKLRAYGWEDEAQRLHPSLAAFEVAPAVAVTFASALTRAGVQERLCGYGYGATTALPLAVPQALDAVSLATMFATGNGVPPASNVQLINDNSVGGAARDIVSRSPSTGSYDLNLDGALCLRQLVDGSGAWATRLKTGLDETRRNGNLRGKPAVIVHGRDDALLPASHTSRPYYALNQKVEGAASRLSYIEVTNAQHFDSFIGLPTILPGYDSRYIPLHVYLNRAMDAVYAHLTAGTALPASQVLRTVPRGGTPGAAPAITAANVPAIPTTPAAANAIAFSGTTLTIPE
ncbi:3-hydroxybutyrate oligomer hydrolase family protein [Pseudorhodoferax sp. Leaf267]|uniref:3-hydroxybutyrate oligomer hydrolase family protein n=1 Tax=Pseudorhodoferax sp. Leaf267 TaxID=1736316 RepID=UPI0006F2CB7E|nr:3-hydroxybutyrate oligomer hydrolase family protein [Pseudorhodoferax sp. Leaf267]KQP22640.1 cytochrome C1 [Pseudorhodoferax sp. Leaf267]